MKTFLLICGGLLLLALADMPMGFYTFLRIIVTIGAVTVVIKEFENGFTMWILIFLLIGVLFNPIIPVYLQDKGTWMPIDIICAVIFFIKSFQIKK